MTLYAIGDIHGRLDLLQQLHQLIEQDAGAKQSERKVIVYLGDYVDRGLQSKGVLDCLLSGPPEGFEGVYLKGNHEEAILDFLRDYNFGNTWKYYGGLETLHSYGVTEASTSDNAEAFEAAQKSLAEKLPEEHLKFLRGLRVSATFGDYFFVHAGVRPGVPLDRQVEDDMLWIRDEFLRSNSSFGKVIVHGHTPEEAPVIARNRIGIDTGAYMTDMLTCLVLTGESREFLYTGSLVPEVINAS